MAIFPRITLHTDTLTANMLGPNRSFSLIMTLNIKKNGPTYRYTCTCVLQTNVFSAVTQGWTAVECRAYIRRAYTYHYTVHRGKREHLL